MFQHKRTFLKLYILIISFPNYEKHDKASNNIRETNNHRKGKEKHLLYVNILLE